MKLKAAILDAMATDQLRQCSDDFDVEVADRRKRDVLVAALRRKRSLTHGELLEYLSEVEVKEVCEALEVSPKGRRAALIERLIAEFEPTNETGSHASEEVSTVQSDSESADDSAENSPGYKSYTIRLFPNSNVREMSEIIRTDQERARASRTPLEPHRQITNMPSLMNKITADGPEATSMNVVYENVEQLKALFPEAFTEGRIDFDVLKQLLGGSVDEREEKYGLNWHGKRRARQLALTPSTGTLRPCPEESVEWDTTQNLMIEGDNLEVLKLLQKSYAGKVKLIYIDPPYNTGKDFVYPDNFKDSIKNYLELTGQVEGGRKISSNTEASGRFHTDWLSMMYPRLHAARQLLSHDGAIICSIGDEEISNLIYLLSEVFGEENRSAHFCIVRSEGGGLAKQVVKGHDYLLVYAKDISAFAPLRRPKDIRGDVVSVDGTDYWIEEDWLRRKFGTYGTCEYREIEECHGAEKKMEIDAGIESGKYRLIKKASGITIVGRLRKVEDDSSKFYSVQKHLNAKAADDLTSIGMPAEVFDFPKPVSLITDLVLGATFFSKRNSDLVVDFFAGSGTTGHAVMVQNALDGGNRRFILVQLPEPLNPEESDQRAAAEFCDTIRKPRNIAELTKERLRRAGKRVELEYPNSAGDVGFRTFKLDESNIRAWQPSDELERDLIDSVEHIVQDRSEQDILTELLLKLGLDLCVPAETRAILGKTVHAIGGGVLLVCLEPRIDIADAEPLALGIAAWQKELAPIGKSTCVFRDSAFSGDVAKTNLAAILLQHGIANVRSL